jgi:hypothetical protein
VPLQWQKAYRCVKNGSGNTVGRNIKYNQFIVKVKGLHESAAAQEAVATMGFKLDYKTRLCYGTNYAQISQHRCTRSASS